MTLWEFVDREIRANPHLAKVYRAYENELLRQSFSAFECGTPIAWLICYAVGPPRYWQELFVTMADSRKALDLPPLEEL